MASFLKRLVRRSDPGLTWETLSRVAVTLGVFLIPLMVVSWTNDVWETTKAMILLVTVGLGWLLYFVAALRRREHRWVMGRLDWVVLGLWVSYALSALTSVNQWQSLVGISGSLVETLPVVTALIGLYFLSGQIFRTESERRAGWGALLAGVGLTLVFQMFQFSDFSLLPPSLPHANTVFSLISSSLTDVAILAALFGTVVLIQWSLSPERWQRYSIVAGAILSWLVILLTGRPIGWAIWAVGMIAVVLTEAARGKKANTRLITVAVLLAAAGMTVQLFGLHRQAGLANGPDVTLDRATTSTIVSEALKDRPVFGTGGTTWYQDFVTYRPVEFNETPYWSNRFIKATNGWWQSLATVGLVGTALWALVLGWSAWSLWRRWSAKPEVASLTGLLVVVSVIISGWFTGWSLPVLVMTWFALGLSRAVTVNELVKKPQPTGLGFPIAFVFVTLAVIGTWFYAGRVYAAEVMVRQAQAAIDRQEDLARIVSRLKKTLKLNSHQADASVLLAGAYATQAEIALQANDSTAATPLIQQAVATMRAAVAADSKNPAIYEAMNNLLNRLNAYVADAADEASRNFVTLRKLEPANPIHDVGYGQTLMIIRARLLSGDTSDATKQQAEKLLADALAAFDSAIAKKSDYPQAVYAKAQAYTGSEQPLKAIALLEPLVSQYPEVSLFWAELGLANSQAKQPEQAVAAFTRAVSLAPQDASLYLALAQHYQDAGQVDLAKQTLEQGLSRATDPTLLQQKLDELNAPTT